MRLPRRRWVIEERPRAWLGLKIGWRVSEKAGRYFTERAAQRQANLCQLFSAGVVEWRVREQQGTGVTP